MVTPTFRTYRPPCLVPDVNKSPSLSQEGPPREGPVTRRFLLVSFGPHSFSFPEKSRTICSSFSLLPRRRQVESDLLDVPGLPPVGDNGDDSSRLNSRGLPKLRLSTRPCELDGFRAETHCRTSCPPSPTPIKTVSHLFSHLYLLFRVR